MTALKCIAVVAVIVVIVLKGSKVRTSSPFASQVEKSGDSYRVATSRNKRVGILNPIQGSGNVVEGDFGVTPL